MPASAAAARSASPIAFGSAYGAAARPVVQVVELAHAGHAGQRHLRERRPRQREVGVRVEPRGDGVHPLAPGPERAAAAVGAPPQRAVEGVAVARWPGRAAPRRPAVRRRRRGCPGLTAVNRPSATSSSTARAGPDGSRACSANQRLGDPALIRPARGRPRQRLDAARGSRPARRAPGASGRRRSGCGRRASRSGCPRWRGCRRRGRRRCPASVSPPSTGEPARERWRRTRSSGVHDSSTGPAPPARRPWRPPRARRVVRPAGVEPGGDPGRDGVDAAGLDGTLPTVATQPCARRRPRAARTAAASRASGRGGPPAGWCPRGWPRRRGPAASGRAARSRPTPTGWPRSTRPRPCSTCSSTNGRSAPASRDRGPRCAGSRPGRRHRLGHGDAVGVGERPGPVGAQRAGDAAATRRRPRRTERPPRPRSWRRRSGGPA